MLKLTGERIVPELMKPDNGMLLEHLARYHFALPYVKGRVLDIACGSGYGCFKMAKECKMEITEVVGVDIDQAAIKYAGRKYNHPLVVYLRHDALEPSLPDKLGLFDTIISFETIEHVRDDGVFLKNLESMLNPGGILVLSTPFGPGRGKPCGQKFHRHQYTREEFEVMLRHLGEVELYYQRGVTFERAPRPGIKYPIGVAVCHKSTE